MAAIKADFRSKTVRIGAQTQVYFIILFKHYMSFKLTMVLSYSLTAQRRL